MGIMMMDCPKCGFTQPKDQYCAQCGIDVDAYNKKPVGFFVGLANNSTLHLGVIAGVILLTLFYLIISQKDLIQEEVGRIFNGLPLLSHSSSEEDTQEPQMDDRAAAPMASSAEQVPSPPPSAGIIEPGPKTNQPSTKAAPPTVEVRYLEVSKENVRALISTGQVVREFENWRVVYFPNTPSLRSIAGSSRELPGSVRQALPSQGDLEILSGDDDPEPNRSFLNFSMIWRIPDSVDWSLITQLRSNENTETFVLREIEGKIKWNPQGALVYIFDPIGRIPVAPNSDFSGSPLQVLQSSDFQNGLSDLLIWVEVTNLEIF